MLEKANTFSENSRHMHHYSKTNLSTEIAY